MTLDTPDWAGPDDAVFHVDGERIVPSLLAQGPWDPRHQHGGAVAGLLARAVERCETLVPMRTARLAIDLMRPVPLRPLRSHARVVRAGKRISVVDVSLLEGELEVARASALLIRLDESAAPPGPEYAGAAPPPARPRHADGFGRELLPHVPGFIRAVDYVRLAPPAPGVRNVAWSRLRCAFVAGEATTPFVRLAAISDFVSGTANALDFARWTSINPDLTLHVLREPEGEWIAVEAWTALARDGIGQSHAVLHDDRGAVGRALSSLLVEPRRADPGTLVKKFTNRLAGSTHW